MTGFSQQIATQYKCYDYWYIS